VLPQHHQQPFEDVNVRQVTDTVFAESSQTLDGADTNYSTTEKECLAIVVVMDLMALKWLNSIESLSERIARLAVELQQFDFEISYRKSTLCPDSQCRKPYGKRK